MSLTVIPRPLRLPVLVAMVAVLAIVRAPSPAHADPGLDSIMMDDNNIIYRNDATRDATLQQMKSMGVDYVRVTVLWADVANGIQAYDKKHHIKFDPSNPLAYPPLNWNRYDGIVQTATRLGLGVYFDVTGPGPSYGHAKPPKSLRKDVADTYEPSPQQFYKFVTAIGKRYSGSFRKGRVVLPRVRVWSLWNEPNQGGWITPQWKQVGGQLIPYSPVIYRALFLYGQQALYNTGHIPGRDVILMGETAPTGVARRDATSAMDPTTFIRELFCVDENFVPYTGAAAAARSCSIFNQFPTFFATAWAHHPYTKTTAPTVPTSNPGDITMADIENLPTLLDKLATVTKRIKPGLDVLSTEFGFESNPPDPIFGIPLAEQAQWDNEGDFLAYFDPRIVAQTQFLLKDAPPLTNFRKGSRQYWSTYQSGLEYVNGTPKPAYGAYLLPFVVAPPSNLPAGSPPSLFLWGQLRFLDNTIIGRSPTSVQIEFHAATAAPNLWTPVGPAQPVSDTLKHVFYTTIPVPGAGQLRLHWSDGGVIPDRYSRPVPITAAGVAGLD
jgi:hypothetical protein